jgi:glycolate oxidase iron-sulfur subunit
LRKCVHCGFLHRHLPHLTAAGRRVGRPTRPDSTGQVLEGAEPTRKTQLHLDQAA